MFKIVETVERGSSKLTIVPFGWEKNGQLAWPKFKADKLIKIADSVPEDGWFKMKCRLKRNHLINLEVAEEELERMLENDETTTDQDEDDNQDRKKRSRILLHKPRSTENDYNNLARSCIDADKVEFASQDTISQSFDDSSIAYNLNGDLASTANQDRKKRPRILLPKPRSAEDDYNNLARSCMVANKIVIASQDTIPQTFDDPSIAYNLDGDLASTTNQIILDANMPTLFQTNQDSSNEQVIKKLDTVLTNQAIIIDNQNKIIEQLDNNCGTKENQMTILQQLAKFEVILDSIATKNISHSTEKPLKKTPNVDVEQVDCFNDAAKLEQNLADSKVMDDLVAKLSIICGRRGNGNGMNSCYLLVDIMFSRKFMTLCSWAGGAKEKKEKIAFKSFKNIIRMFFKVVYLSDEHFTVKDCEEFFKNVIRNATRRNASKMCRTSKIKRRPTNLSYKQQQNVEEEEEKEDERIGEDEQEEERHVEEIELQAEIQNFQNPETIESVSSELLAR